MWWEPSHTSILIIVSDNENAFRFIDRNHLTHQGIQLFFFFFFFFFFFTAPHTSSQKGPAERAGQILDTITRSLRIDSRLPAN